jgi:hypothetical protein
MTEIKEIKKEKPSIGKIISTREYADSVYSGYILITNKGKYFLYDTELDYDILKMKSINENGIKFFYIGVIKWKHIADDIILPIETLKEIYNQTDNINLKRDINNLFKKLGEVI